MRPHLLVGVGVSPGVALGPAVVVRQEFPEVPDRTVREDEVEAEVARLHEAVRHAVGQLQELRERVHQRAGPEESGIFDAQMMMAEDADFLRGVELLIRNNLLSAETAYEFKGLELRELWSATASARLRERLTDLTAVQRRILDRLMGRVELDILGGNDGAEQVIIVARELSPGLTVQLDREYVVALVSEEGTRTSHAAILAHSLGIPAVMGVPGAVDQIAAGATLLVDGHAGTVVIDPTPDELDEARTRVTRRRKLEFELEGIAGEPAVTRDGRPVTLQANVDLPEEIEPALRVGAQGVGLLRTEFLVTGRTTLPSEDEQAEYFRRVATAFTGQTVILRSFDLGGDKFPAAFEAPPEANPMLGWRSIRVCLDRPEVFRAQLRAVLRAAVDRDIQLMLPLVTGVAEVTQARDLLLEEAHNLSVHGIRAAASVPIGVMIETPAAVVIADQLAEVSAFFSIGSNDLIQYTLAVDRGNAHLAQRFQPHHPAVLRQLRTVVEVGRAAGIPVGICGEMASDPLSAIFLIGVGYDRLSVGPPALPLLKYVVRALAAADCEAAARAALTATTAEAATDALRDVAAAALDLRLVDPSATLPRGPRPASLPSRS